ncbi:2-oxoglutarate dehydrogenase, E2 component, dihydrolipoamide succinyltransferase [Terracidiphilus gabretensis]|uniref:2-oxoglutarate dehydrogenase, E2 component, dihydrolipoamide succinyltransferase n=1 Tax=Terracidiphilus gabretensis TaxID=1577687 RepID=UPI00071BD37B|nr:2-oxoglutarate dehydrogenase, E2 component, dihydrolipoamide succinyltransferase [Terracidiphilus gabretensis]
MPTDVVMPQMGESIFEGTITKWLKKPGDVVEKDEPLFEISTDKVDAEIPAPASGILSEIKCPEGETVTINTVVAVIGGSNEAPVPASSTAAAEPAPAVAPKSEEPKQAATPAPVPVPQSQPAPIVSDEPLRSSPLVRRIAREHNIDLRHIRGTGSAGRINKDDILSYLADGGTAASAQSASQAQSPGRPVPTLKDELVPMSRMRSIIAERMLESRRTSPHAYSIYKVDMTRVVRLRERTRAAFEQRHGVKLTFMPFIAAAAIDALRQFPIVNASIETNGGVSGIRYHGNIHLGIAVALEWGLIVPVVRQAETLSFPALARAIADLAERARTKKLKPEEASGSTFTLTNSGVFGGEYGTPILNQPEAAILAIGGLKKEPVVLTDSEGNDTIAIRSMQTHCLGFDHRIIDGADAGKFMTTFKDTLENWNREIV